MKTINNWDDITINQYFEIKSYGDNIEDTTLVSIIYDISEDDVDELTYDEFNQLLIKLKFMNAKPKPHNRGFVGLNNQVLCKIPSIQKISFGEFVDIENWINSDNDEDMLFILATYYRKNINDDPDFNGIKLEPYGEYVLNRAKHFGELPVSILFDVVDEINKFRIIFQENYGPLLMLKEDELDDEVINDETIADKRARIEEEANQKRLNKWGWEVLVYKLANGDITKFEEIYSLPLIQIMNMLAMQSELKLE
jgi:hypothetical protein